MEGVPEYISRCQTWEGGIAGEEGLEAGSANKSGKESGRELKPAALNVTFHTTSNLLFFLYFC